VGGQAAAAAEAEAGDRFGEGRWRRCHVPREVTIGRVREEWEGE
jgi:hypothetical protein